MAGTAQTWPPAYGAGPSAEPAAARPAPPNGGGAARPYPPPGWPTAEQLEYTQKGITVLLLLLALPWLAFKLLTNPGYVLAGAGRHHIKPPGT